MDILERLRWLERDAEAKANLPEGAFKLARDAAQEIQHLRTWLERIANEPLQRPLPGGSKLPAEDLQYMARQALRLEEDD